MIGSMVALALATIAPDGGSFDPIAFISQPIVVQTGATGILVFVVISILRGWLIPRRIMLDLVAEKDAQIARLVKERDDWHTAHTISEVGRAELKDQNGKLINGQENMNRFVDEFHRYFGRRESEPQILRQIEGSDHA